MNKSETVPPSAGALWDAMGPRLAGAEGSGAEGVGHVCREVEWGAGLWSLHGGSRAFFGFFEILV